MEMVLTVATPCSGCAELHLVHVCWGKAFLLPYPLCCHPLSSWTGWQRDPSTTAEWDLCSWLFEHTQLDCTMLPNSAVFLNTKPILWLCIYYLLSSCYRGGTSPKTMRPLSKLKPDKDQGCQGICILLPTPFLWALEFLSRYSSVQSHIFSFY